MASIRLMSPTVGADGDVTFTHDGLGRLYRASESVSGYQRAYGYDALGRPKGILLVCTTFCHRRMFRWGLTLWLDRWSEHNKHFKQSTQDLPN